MPAKPHSLSSAGHHTSAITMSSKLAWLGVLVRRTKMFSQKINGTVIAVLIMLQCIVNATPNPFRGV
jgi:hypothetical protein